MLRIFSSVAVALLLFSSCSNQAAGDNKNAAATTTTNASTNSSTPQTNASVSAAPAPARLVSAKEFVDEMLKRKDGEYYLIDVRTDEECAQGMLVGAQKIDFNAPDFEEQLGKLDRSREVFIYCKAGGRSAKASKIAEKLGFKAVFDMDGGYDAWMKL